MLSHPWTLLFLFLLNVGFIFAFAFYGQPLGDKISYTIQLMGDLFTKIVQSANSPAYLSAAAHASLADIIMSEPIFQRLASDLISLFALLAAATYVVYTFFQSTSIRLIGWMVIDRRPFSLWTFIKITIGWYVIYLFCRLLIFVVDLLHVFFSNGKGVLSSFDFLNVILNLLVFYFVFISYAFAKDKEDGGSVWQSMKQGVRFGVKKAHYYVLNFLLFALYLIPYTNDHIVAPALNIFNSLGILGYAIQLLVLFFLYTFLIANIFTITYEVAPEIVSQDDTVANTVRSSSIRSTGLHQ